MPPMPSHRAALPIIPAVDDEVRHRELDLRIALPAPNRHIADAAVLPLHDRSGDQIIIVLLNVHDHPFSRWSRVCPNGPYASRRKSAEINSDNSEGFPQFVVQVGKMAAQRAVIDALRWPRIEMLVNRLFEIGQPWIFVSHHKARGANQDGSP